MSGLRTASGTRRSSVAAVPLAHGGHRIERPSARTWVDYRESLARAVSRCEPPVCEGCGCEIDRWPVPHSPRCTA